jgi:hypothetical protein
MTRSDKEEYFRDKFIDSIVANGSAVQTEKGGIS